VSDAVAAFPPEAAFTHFHSADRDAASRDVQARRFTDAVGKLPVRPAMVHAENSAAVEHAGPSTWSVVRPGVFLYGVGSGHAPLVAPEPVVSVRARIVDLRTIAPGETVSYGGTFRAAGTRRIATIAIGYADGYRRSVSNRAHALLHGTRVPVVGLVTMDMTMLDVTDAPCAIGDIVTLIGADGPEHIDVNEIASLAELSPYEILTGLRGRLPRRYFGDQG
jgi:alanine racemase